MICDSYVIAQDLREFFSGFFGEIWRMFTAFTIPGTSLKASNVLVGLLFADVMLTFIRKVLDNQAVGASNLGYHIGSYVDVYKRNHDVKNESRHAKAVRDARSTGRNFLRNYEKYKKG